MHTHPAPSRPAASGVLLALAAAALFGAGTPLIKLAGAGVGMFGTAALLYAGAALAGWLTRRPAEREAPLRRDDAPWLAAMALFGAALAPAALAWGLQRSSATAASLLLTLEAVFTAVLARACYGEALDKRIALAMGLLLAGGLALVVDGSTPGDGWQVSWGLLAVAAATAAWGLDNTLSRRVADRDPGQVVAWKATLGALLSTALAALLGEALPAAGAAAALLVIGATTYGLSLRLYLLAQRALGALRTGSVFAFAPFVGAALAIAGGERSGGALAWAGGGLMLAGLLLHLNETHAHHHEHEALEHEHAHRHDDGHHAHRHEASTAAEHSHAHRHAAGDHAHPHVPDAHHLHRH